MPKQTKPGRPFVHFYLIDGGSGLEMLTQKEMDELLSAGAIPGEQVIKVKVLKTYKVRNARQELV